MDNLYESDFYSWSMQQAELVRSGQFDRLDIDHLIEELESMGSSQLHSLESHLRVLLCHLLKYEYQPQRRGRSWDVTIITQRDQAQIVLYDNPGFKHKLEEVLQSAYRKARKNAADQTKLPLKSFPLDCPWSFEQVMEEDWLP